METCARIRDFLVTSCLNALPAFLDRGDLQGALESVRATIREDSTTEAQLSGWREHLQELVAEQEAEAA